MSRHPHLLELNFLRNSLRQFFFQSLRRRLLLLNSLHRFPLRPLHTRAVRQDATDLNRPHDRQAEIHRC